MVAKKKAELTVVEGSPAPTPMFLDIPLDTLSKIAPDQLKELFALKKDMEADAARKAFAVAFGKCQQEMLPIVKDKKGDKGLYATYLQLDTALRPIYSKNGFTVSFNSGDSQLPEHVKVFGYLLHESGHERTYEADIPCDGKGAKGNDVMTKTHARGSAFTYGKRYLLIMMFNIALRDKADDDGKAAGGTLPDAPLTDEQIDELRAVITGVNANEERFCRTLEVDGLGDLMQSQLENAKKRVLAWAKKAKQVNNEPA